MYRWPPPTGDELRAVERLLGRRSRVVGVRRLRGGITSAVHQLSVVDGGHRRSVVLRRFHWDDVDGARWTVEVERWVSESLGPTSVPVPVVLQAAHDGLVPGAPPALVMERAPGRPDLMPAVMSAWLDELATVAATIHDLDVTGPTPFEPWVDPDLLRVPDGAARADVWQAAHEAVRAGAPPTTRTTFIHRDYQHFNLLWRRGRITTVLDWGGTTNGPAAIDVGHCRLNLAVLFTPEIAEDFRLRYEALTGTAVDPWWDLQELVVFGRDWPTFIPLQVAGRGPVDPPGMVGRVEQVVEAALRRLG